MKLIPSRQAYFAAAIALVATAALLVLKKQDEAHSSQAGSESGILAPQAGSSRPSSDSKPRMVSAGELSRSPREDTLRVGLDSSLMQSLSPSKQLVVDDIVARIQREARAQLDQLRIDCALSASQARDIYPLLVAHHPLAHRALTVRGEPIPPPAPPLQLAEALYPLLDDSQRSQLVDQAIERQAWWDEIIGQLSTDLDQSLLAAESAIGSEPAPTEVAPGITVESVEHSDNGADLGGAAVNLFDLLGP